MPAREYLTRSFYLPFQRRFFRLQRNKYYKHIFKASQEPQKYMSLIIDGMDQKKTDLPSPRYKSKATDGNQRINTHVTGVLANGIGALLFYDTKEFGKGPNSVMTILVETFRRLLQHYKDKKLSWPKVLYLQMDNAASENKNKFVLRFCALLVHFGLFEKVRHPLFPLPVKFYTNRCP